MVGDNMHGQIVILHQTFLDVVSPSDNPEQTRISQLQIQALK